MERGRPPQADPCSIVEESFWRLGEHLYFTLVFACPACASVSPLIQTHLYFPCDAKTHTRALPAPQPSALKSPGHLSPISAPTFSLPDVPPQAEIAPWFRHCAGGLAPISSPVLQSPNKQPNPQAELDGLCGICHGNPQAASAPRGWEQGDGQQGPPAVPVPEAGHFQWGEDPVLVLLGAWVLLLEGAPFRLGGCWEGAGGAYNSQPLISPLSSFCRSHRKVGRAACTTSSGPSSRQAGWITLPWSWGCTPSTSAASGRPSTSCCAWMGPCPTTSATTSPSW